MRLTEITYDGPAPIDSYGPGFFRVKGELHEGALGLLEGIRFSWGGLNDFDRYIDAKSGYDVLFIGMGAEIVPLPLEIQKKLEAAEVPFEVMGTASACRTYNVLLSEGRRVALALLPVSAAENK